MAKLADIKKYPKYYFILLCGKFFPKNVKWDRKYGRTFIIFKRYRMAI